MSNPEGWKNADLREIMYEDQVEALIIGDETKTLTQAKIKEIVHRKTDKMDGVVVPDFLVYALMHRFKVYV